MKPSVIGNLRTVYGVNKEIAGAIRVRKNGECRYLLVVRPADDEENRVTWGDERFNDWFWAWEPLDSFEGLTEVAASLLPKIDAECVRYLKETDFEVVEQ
jgi:hypothetical protein